MSKYQKAKDTLSGIGTRLREGAQDIAERSEGSMFDPDFEDAMFETDHLSGEMGMGGRSDDWMGDPFDFGHSGEDWDGGHDHGASGHDRHGDDGFPMTTAHLPFDSQEQLDELHEPRREFRHDRHSGHNAGINAHHGDPMLETNHLDSHQGHENPAGDHHGNRRIFRKGSGQFVSEPRPTSVTTHRDKQGRFVGNDLQRVDEDRTRDGRIKRIRE